MTAETPVAAVAVPTAPVAPVAAPAVAVAPVVAPEPVAAPVVAAAPAVAAPAAPAVAPEPSLLDGAAVPAAAPQTEAEKIVAARELIKQADAAADPNSGKAWLLTDGVMGTGEKPGWFLQDKYKNVAEQAKAYPELAKRFGGFTGAPKNEKGEVAYAFKAPEGFAPDILNLEHPTMQAFTKWAGENQLSQDGYNGLLGQLIQYETQAQTVDMKQVKARMGDKAQERIDSVVAWSKANLGDAGFASMVAATRGKNADVVFKVLEQVIGKTAQTRMPKAGDDVPSGQASTGLAAAQAAMAVKDPATGKLRIHVDRAYHLEVDKKFRDAAAAQGQ